MITTIAHSGMPGVQSVFKNMEALGMSKNLPIDQITSLQDIGNVVIFGAFDTSYLPLMNILRNDGQPRNIGFIWTSSPTETELQPGEINFLHYILRMKIQGQIDFLWFLKPDYLEMYGEIHDVFYAPAPCPEYKFRNPPDVETKQLSLFMPAALKKNAFAQHLAASSLALNNPGKIIVKSNNGAYKLPGITNIGWMSDEMYEKELNFTDIAMHVSLAESFAYGAYKFLARGIPCLISPSIGRNLEVYNSRLKNLLVVKDSDSLIEMGIRLQNLFNFSHGDYKVLCQLIYDEMSAFRTCNNQRLKKVFEEQNLR